MVYGLEQMDGGTGLRKITKRQSLLRAKKDRKRWRAMINKILKGYGASAYKRRKCFAVIPTVD